MHQYSAIFSSIHQYSAALNIPQQYSAVLNSTGVGLAGCVGLWVYQVVGCGVFELWDVQPCCKQWAAVAKQCAPLL